MKRRDFLTASAVLWCSAGERGRHIPKDVASLILTREGQAKYRAHLRRELRDGRARADVDVVTVNSTAPTASLAEIAKLYLASAPSPEGDSFTAVLRRCLAVDPDAPLEEVLASCSGVSASEVHTIPERAYGVHLQHPHERKIAQAAQAAVRRALVAVGATGAVSMVFPACWAEELDTEEAAVVTALRECFLEGVRPTYAAIAERSGLGTKCIQAVHARLEAHRILSRTDNVAGIGRIPHVLNPSRVPVDQVSLSDVLTRFLEHPSTTKDQRRALRTALRQHLRLSRAASQEDLVAACHAVPASRFQRLPHEVEDSAKERGIGNRNARNNASIVRTAVRLAVEEGTVPMVFPVAWLDDPWESTREAWLPTDLAGRDRVTLYNWRMNWGHAAQAARAALDPSKRPEDLTAEDVERLALWWKRRGSRNRATRVRTLFRELGRRRKGPLAEQPAASVRDWFAYGPDGGAPETLGDTLKLIRSLGLPEEWEEFWTWYWRWSTAEQEDLELNESTHPPRPERRQLSTGTLVGRCYSLRLLLGISANYVGAELAALQLDVALGYDHISQVVAHARKIWKARASEGELSTDVGGALRRHIVGIGMLSEALYRRRQHERGVRRRGKSIKLSRQRELGRRKTQTERQLWAAYEHCQYKAIGLQKRARKVGPVNSVNTEKDLRRILQHTPGSFWVRLLETLLSMAERSIAEDGATIRHHRLIRIAYLTALVVSTGFRWEELVHVRLDIQYSPGERNEDGDRRIHLRACDRKNSRAHTGVVREQFVPQWLEQHYLSVTRPMLMAKLAPEERHHHLIVSTGGGKYPAGRAYGDPNERPDGECRDWHRVEAGKNALRLSWQDATGKVAFEKLGVAIPTGRGEWAGHAIRSAIAHAIYQTARASNLNPAVVTGNWLGDDPGTVLDVYATVGAEFLDPAIFDELRRMASELNLQPSAMPTRARELQQQISEKEAALDAALKRVQELEVQIQSMRQPGTSPEIQAEVRRQIAALLSGVGQA